MTRFRGDRQAFGQPGVEPRWTHGDKDGIGTAYSVASRVWFTLWNGILTEIYYPTIDRPQTRDIQYLVSDGSNFLHKETSLNTKVERLWRHALGYRITNSDSQGRYSITKEVISDPLLPCVLQHTTLNCHDANLKDKLSLYLLAAPHLEVGGKNNNAYIIQIDGKEILVAEKKGTWLAIAATVPFLHLSCGYVGKSDGWEDLADNYQMDWDFDCATDGNVALTGQLDWRVAQNDSGEASFTLGIAFGDCLHAAVTSLLQSLALPFAKHKARYEQQWQPPCDQIVPLEKVSHDDGGLYYGSLSVLVSHEDKTYHGALIASLSIPWGEAKGDEEKGGYHLVWTRDMVNSATALLAAGNRETPLRALIYLATSQQSDGSFPQRFWINGEPNSCGIQLDQMALPILLAHRLHKEDALRNFDPYPFVTRAASFLMKSGPVTEQERWEEASGYSPSTLATIIAALICAACFARERGDETTAHFIEDYADFLECHLETWTVTTTGTLVPDIPKHYIRILPAEPDKSKPAQNPDEATLYIINRPEDDQAFPAKEVVDGGFLELVRYGIRKADDPIIVDSLKVVDQALKVDTPAGEAWHRYNHDGYGQQADGSAFNNIGVGRLWPLLTGERGHYELAAGKDVSSYIKTIEGLASETGLLPEQVWDSEDIPEAHMYLGKPTGSAMPLMWSHAEYIKLLRSAFDNQVFDLIPEVAQRYCNGSNCHNLEIWQPTHQATSVQPNYTLRIQAAHPFKLKWSTDEGTEEERAAVSTQLGIGYVDIAVPENQKTPIRFTFVETQDGNHQGESFEVEIR
ncbi:MAG: glycoside hydrolase family 15 protein [Spirulinaceae cyanobacterium]